MDRAVSAIDFRALAGRTVYLDTEYVKGTTDGPYLISSLRQQMLASGCIVMNAREEADYILEVRAGAMGTDRNDLLYGLPATQLPSIGPAAGIPTAIPEIPLVKRTHQRGVAKIAVFAYNRETGRPVWQSGVVPGESKAKNFWVFGAGPFQRGQIYDGTTFAGSKLDVPLIQPGSQRTKEQLSVADEAFFVEPAEELARRPPRAGTSGQDRGAPGNAPPAAPATPTSPVTGSEASGTPPRMPDPAAAVQAGQALDRAADELIRSRR